MRDADRSPPDAEEILAVSRGIATAVAPASGLTDVQVAVLHAITKALTDVSVDYRDLEPLGPDELARVLAAARYRVPPAHRAPHGAR